jgi:hypothetical protein
LINGGFNFCQRLVGTSGTFTTVSTQSANDNYGLDRWCMSAGSDGSDDVACAIIDTGNASLEAGLNARFYGSFEVVTNNAKFSIAQILEGIDTVPLRGRQVTFQVKLKASTAKNIRIAIIQNAAAATMDTIAHPILVTSNGDTTDPTWNTNLSQIPVDIATNCINLSNAGTCAVTTAWQNFAITCTVPVDCENLLCVIFPDAEFTASPADVLSVAEAGLYNTNAVQQYWAPRPISEELSLCQRYCFAIHGTTNGTFACTLTTVLGGTQSFWYLQPPVTMFATPTFTFVGTLSHITISDSGESDVLTSAPTISYANQTFVRLTVDVSTFTVGTAVCTLDWTSATAADIFILSAEL